MATIDYEQQTMSTQCSEEGCLKYSDNTPTVHFENDPCGTFSLMGFNFDPAIEEALCILCIMFALSIASACRTAFLGSHKERKSSSSKNKVSVTNKSTNKLLLQPYPHRTTMSSSIHTSPDTSSFECNSALALAHHYNQGQHFNSHTNGFISSYIHHQQPGQQQHQHSKVSSRVVREQMRSPYSNSGGRAPIKGQVTIRSNPNVSNISCCVPTRPFDSKCNNTPNSDIEVSTRALPEEWVDEGDVIHHRPPKDKLCDVGVPACKDQKTLLIAYYPWEAREDDVFNVFGKFADVKRVRLIVDRDSKRPKCYGFVKFATTEQAQIALKCTLKGLIQLRDMRGHIWHVKGEWAWSGEMMLDDDDSCTESKSKPYSEKRSSVHKASTPSATGIGKKARRRFK